MTSEIPEISISLDDSVIEQDSETKGLCIDDAKTDVEDLDSDSEQKLSNGLLSTVCKKPRGSLTDVENFTSDSERENYDTKDYAAKITLDEFLDQGQVDESAAYFGTKKKDMPKMKSKPKEMTTNLLVINDAEPAGITDCEDMQDSGPEEEEPVIKYEYDDKPIVLEDGGSINIHDANKKRTSTYIPKTKEPSSDSSDDEPPTAKVRHPPRHHLHHKHHHPRSINDAKSDVENMMFSDDEKKPRKPSAPMINVDDADEVTFEASDAEDMDPQLMAMSKSMTFPEINITFATDMPSDKKIDRTKPASTLGVPVNKDDALTDVEDLDSSDSDNEGASAYPKCKLWKQIIPKAVIKDHRDTDEEDMGQVSDAEGLLDPCLTQDIDVPLPSPHRELKIVKDNENGQPQVELLPIGDNFLLGICNYEDGGLTDCEECFDENDDAENYDESKYILEKLPEIDGGSVESADKTIDKNQPSRPVSSMSSGNLCVQVNENPVTDTEEMIISNANSSNAAIGTCELRRRRGKGKSPQLSSKNSGFLIVSENQDGGHTDVEEMDFDDDETKGKFDAKRRPTLEIATIMNSNDTMTDEECFSGGEECMAARKSPDSRPLSALNQENYCSSITAMDCLDVNKPAMRNNRRLTPIIRKISPSPDAMMNPVTDTEDIPCNSDADEPYSRAQTATPNEVQKVLQDTLEHSEIHEAHTGAFDLRKERKHLKDPRELDAHTDVSDIELPVGNGKI